MKKLFFALLLAAVALTGCNKDETTDVVLHDVELKASIDLNASRVAFDQDGNFFWTVNDAIGVTTTASKSNFQKMKMKDGGAGQATATFKGSYMSGTPEGYAVYPYNNKHKMNGSELTYNFPTSYNYTIEDHSYFVTDGTGNSFNPAMWATIEDGRVHFKHLGGVFCIAVADMPAGDNQTLTVTTSQRITGDFTTDLAANPVLVTDNEAGNEVTINFSNAEESDRVFYVPVPTGLYEKICISFEADGELVEVYFEDKRVNARSLKIMRIGEFELEGGEAEQAAKQKKALEEVCAAGVGEIQLTSDVTFDQILTIAEPQAVTRAAEAATITIDGNGHKLISTAARAINVETTGNVVIKNLTVECTGERAVNVINKPANVTLENVTMTAANYAVNAATSAAGAKVAVKNSTLTGLNVVNIAAANAVVTVEKTTLNCEDNTDTEGYAALALYYTAVDATITATGCTFNISGDSFKGSVGSVGGEITIDGTTDGVEQGVAYIGYPGEVAYIFSKLEEAIEYAKADETITLVRDITASEIVVVDKAITIDGNGHKLTSTAARAINVQAEGNVVIKNLTVECTGERAVNVIQKPANVTLENVTMKAANYTVNAASSAPGAVIAVKNSTLTGLNVVNIAAANAEVTVEKTTLNCVDKNPGENYAALTLNKDAVNGVIAATNCTFNIDGESDKAKNGAKGGVITIDGKTDEVVEVNAIIEYGDYYYSFTTLEAAIAKATAGETITLIRDIELNASLVLTDEGTLDLNGHSISQQQAQSAAYNMIQNKGNWTIKNGTLDYADVANLTAGVNYVSNTIQNGGSLTLENVKVVNNSDSTVAANGYPHPIDNSGKLVINSGEFTNNANYSSMRIWCTEDTDTEVIINGGTFNGAIDFHNVSAKPNKGTLTINGGMFNPDTYTNAAVRLLGFGVDVDEINGYIKGGTFNGAVKLNKYASGEFNSQVFFVSGGKFKFNPSDFLVEGYTSTQEGDYYVVK